MFNNKFKATTAERKCGRFSMNPVFDWHPVETSGAKHTAVTERTAHTWTQSKPPKIKAKQNCETEQ